MPVLVLIGAGLLPAAVRGRLLGVIATRACVYWVLLSGLNLMVGFAGQLAIGWVALLTSGPTSPACSRPATSCPPVTLSRAAIAGVFGALFGSSSACRRCGCARSISPSRRSDSPPSSRKSRSLGRASPAAALACRAGLAAAVRHPVGVLLFLLRHRGDLHLDDDQHCGSRFGRALTAIRDAEVAAEACRHLQAGAAGHGLPVQRRDCWNRRRTVRVAAVLHHARCLHGRLSVLFFIGVLIGGRGSILGPLLGTILLTVLPEFAAPLVAWSTFLYAALLLASCSRSPAASPTCWISRTAVRFESNREIVPRPELLQRLMGADAEPGVLTLEHVALTSAAFGRSTASI